ncbi:ABC transporter substrate-binding protein [Actinophytocola oryzae]|uniref:Amino acid/amide ABC transporter substrate-binding protein (HAAT family) n=1 Tax=Actinophytocola oryzae TaxID=502181 RepID=A0A4R7W478_9PSEU|nr:ABC transporter substrate-binding protein [Actinophytocola oryzae]TDV56427.1 amino acid/amide ABC transporter substrate-binding protein (HAAT family) [Actinophytocola oryzae]
MKRTGFAGLAVVGVAAALVLSACGSSDSNDSGGSGGGGGGKTGGTFKLGLVTSSSGPFASNAKVMQDGAEYAVKVFNKAAGANGNKVELVTVDGQNNPTTLATLIPQLVTKDQVYAIVGPVDSAGCDIACAASNKLKVPLVSPGAGRPGVLANARPYAFTLAQPDADNSTPVLTKIVKDEKVKTAAIITDDANSTTKAQADLFSKVFSSTGVRVVKTVTFKTGDSSFASQITSVAGDHPDMLALAAGPDDAGRIAKEVKSQNLDVLLAGTGSLQSGGAAYVAAGGEATEGTVAAAQYDPHSTNATADKLLKAAQKDSGLSDIPLNYAYAYDAVNMIMQVIKDKGISAGGNITQDRVTIQEGLNDLKDFTGMADKTTFSSDGTAVRPELRAVVKGGKFVIDQGTS